MLVSLLIPVLAMASFAADNHVKLYDSPNAKAKVVATVDSLQNFVPFYKKDQWLKVGNKKTGATAWLKLPKPQVQQPQIESTFIQLQQTNKQKPTLLVYQNGKKLNQKQAQAIYRGWQKQQKKMQQQFWQEQRNLNDLMIRQDQEMQLMLHNMMRTVPVLNQQEVMAKPAKVQVDEEESPERLASNNKQAQQKIHDGFNRTSSRILNARKAIQDLHQQQTQ